MNKQIIIDIKIDKDNNNLCDRDCFFIDIYGFNCKLFKQKLISEVKRCRKCMLREIMFLRKIK